MEYYSYPISGKINTSIAPIFVSKSSQLFSRLRNVIESTISFSGKTKNCCVGIVDIVNSTHTAAKMSNGKSCKYYSIFLNSMSTIVEEFGGKIVKNLGDSVLYYFPQTWDGSNKHAFISSLECGVTMMEARDIINARMADFGLEPLNYRISADYGCVIIGEAVTSHSEDIFGPTVNLCAKINSKAPTNGMVIGGDLHLLVKSYDEYHFDFVTEFSSGFKFQYPIYSVRRNYKGQIGRLKQ